MSVLTHALVFLISTIFNSYIFICLFRLILQFFRFNRVNPITEFIATVTNPVVIPLQKIFFIYKGFDSATFVFTLLLEMVKFTLLMLLILGAFKPIMLFILSLGDMLNSIINIFFFGILISVILSWFSPQVHHPVMDVLHAFTEPPLNFARRYIPPISGFDLSPLIVLIILKLIQILFVYPLMGGFL